MKVVIWKSPKFLRTLLIKFFKVEIDKEDE